MLIICVSAFEAFKARLVNTWAFIGEKLIRMQYSTAQNGRKVGFVGPKKIDKLIHILKFQIVKQAYHLFFLNLH